MAQCTVPELIRKKRDGEVLSDKEMQYFVQSSLSGNADLSQIGAMLMAMYKSDLSNEETSALTSCMVNSGNTLCWPGIVLDKHSTGGVGDKVSIPLVPALASLGFTVPMVSGRGLGWTGGTLDKLESIPGYKVELTRSDMEKCLQQCSSFIAATTKDLCPADKIFYKIRDITSTIDNLNLITGSILSKKIAAGVQHLVLDIKVGNAAFMKSTERAEELAKKMICVSKSFNMKTRALLTRMDQPIGMTIGNSLEIEESIEILLRKGPEDLLQLVTHIGGELLHMSGNVETVDIGKKRVKQVIADGSALNHFYKMLLSQGVSEKIASRLVKGDYSVLPRAKHNTDIKSKYKGFLDDIDGLTLGKVTWTLGAGRNKAEDEIDYSVGIRLHKKIGDYVDIDDILITVCHNKPISSTQLDDIIKSFSFSNQKPDPKNIIIKSIN